MGLGDGEWANHIRSRARSHYPLHKYKIRKLTGAAGKRAAGVSLEPGLFAEIRINPGTRSKWQYEKIGRLSILVSANITPR